VLGTREAAVQTFSLSAGAQQLVTMNSSYNTVNTTPTSNYTQVNAAGYYLMTYNLTGVSTNGAEITIRLADTSDSSYYNDSQFRTYFEPGQTTSLFGSFLRNLNAGKRIYVYVVSNTATTLTLTSPNNSTTVLNVIRVGSA
jgi:hypothetical protein